MPGKTYDELTVGDTAEVSRTISESDVYLFAGVTGDMNPVHVNEQYASKTVFKHRIAHGVLLCGLISGVLGQRLPGEGTIFVTQTVSFKAPVYIGETVTAQVKVKEKREKNRVVLTTTIAKEDGTVVIDGEAEVLAPRPPK